MIRSAAAATLAALLLTACSSGGQSSSTDPYAGLDQQILSWRTSIEAAHPACAAKVEGKGCQDFQVMCKAAQEITPQDAGVTAKVVAAMTFAGRNPDGSTGKSGSSFAIFSKAGDTWTRRESPPVNLGTCAPV